MEISDQLHVSADLAPRKTPRYLLDRRMGRPRNCPAVMAKKKDFPRQGDSQVGSSIPYLVAMLCDLKGKILVYLK